MNFLEYSIDKVVSQMTLDQYSISHETHKSTEPFQSIIGY